MNSDASRLLNQVFHTFQPPPKQTVSEWSEENVIISSEYGAEPGKYTTARAPYQKGLLDAICDPEISRVTIKSSSQIGKSQILLNIVGYYSSIDPCPILVLNPTIEMSETFSKDRLQPFFRDCKVLHGLLKDNRSKNSGNTILRKRLKNHGIIVLAGTNSASSLASRSIRILIMDEVDRFCEDVEGEGSPIDVALARTANFWNRKVILVSTPVEEETSQIEKSFQRGDKREFFVPCPDCKQEQTLSWKHDGEYMVKMDNGDPDTAYYQCRYCDFKITDKHKHTMLSKGRWIATELEPKEKGHASFYINSLYSPWVKFSDLQKSYLSAKDKGTESLKTFYNTKLGWCWKDSEVGQVSPSELKQRAIPYPAQVPMAVGVLTAGVDVQADRLEVTVLGHGKFEQTWIIDHRIFYGNTEDLTHECWKNLDVFLMSSLQHESGLYIKILATFIDAGFLPDVVYTFTKARFSRLVFASRGSSNPKAEPVPKKPQKGNKQDAYMYWLGVNALKARFYGRIKIKNVDQAGYIHIPVLKTIDEEYLKQLMSERLGLNKKGQKTYVLKKGITRNEALDTFGYATAAYLAQNISDIDRRVDEFISYANSQPVIDTSDLDEARDIALNVGSEIRIVEKTKMDSQSTPENKKIPEAIQPKHIPVTTKRPFQTPWKRI